LPGTGNSVLYGLRYLVAKKLSGTFQPVEYLYLKLTRRERIPKSFRMKCKAVYHKLKTWFGEDLVVPVISCVREIDIEPVTRHAGNGYYICKICNTRFEKYNITYHIMRKHPDIIDKHVANVIDRLREAYSINLKIPKEYLVEEMSQTVQTEKRYWRISINGHLIVEDDKYNEVINKIEELRRLAVREKIKVKTETIHYSSIRRRLF